MRQVLSIRIPTEMLNKLRLLAAREHRSVGSQVRYFLARELRREGRLTRPERHNTP